MRAWSSSVLDGLSELGGQKSEGLGHHARTSGPEPIGLALLRVRAQVVVKAARAVHHNRDICHDQVLRQPDSLHLLLGVAEAPDRTGDQGPGLGSPDA